MLRLKDSVKDHTSDNVRLKLHHAAQPLTVDACIPAILSALLPSMPSEGSVRPCCAWFSVLAHILVIIHKLSN
jgi:hypothetical protein